MFKNVGAKVKGIIKFFFWLSVIIECVAAVVAINLVRNLFSWDSEQCTLYICLIIVVLVLFFLASYVAALFGMCFAQVTLEVEKISKHICGDEDSKKTKSKLTVDPAFVVNSAEADADKQNPNQ